jgi:hypothetical protein
VGGYEAYNTGDSYPAPDPYQLDPYRQPGTTYGQDAYNGQDAYSQDAYPPGPSYQQQRDPFQPADPYRQPQDPFAPAQHQAAPQQPAPQQPAQHQSAPHQSAQQPVDPADPLGLGPAARQQAGYDDPSLGRPYLGEQVYSTGERLRPDTPPENRHEWP